MITSTPTQCQNTEMLLNSATRCDEKMLIIACRTRITTKTTKISSRDDRVGEVEDPEVEAPEVEDEREELGAEPVHGRDDRDQPEQVEPAREPRPDRAAELVRPPVGAAGGRVGRGHLGHAEGDGQDDQADDRPAPGDGDRAAEVPRLRVGREAPREDRDDRERDREVREPRPTAGQLLLVTELRESLLVPVQSLIGHAHVVLVGSGDSHRPAVTSSSSSVRTGPDSGPWRRPDTRRRRSAAARSRTACSSQGSRRSRRSREGRRACTGG